jgi:hypothetical protein
MFVYKIIGNAAMGNGLCLHTPDIIHNGWRSLLFLFWLRLCRAVPLR